jgi:hypothetical protein
VQDDQLALGHLQLSGMAIQSADGRLQILSVFLARGKYWSFSRYQPTGNV